MMPTRIEDQELERLDACIQLALLAAYADGHLAEEERKLLRECIVVHAQSERDARLMLELAAQLPTTVSPLPVELRKTRIKQIMSALPTRQDRSWAFRLAVDVTKAHRGIGLRETRVLIDLVLSLGLDGDEASRLLRQAQRKPNASPQGDDFASKAAGSKAAGARLPCLEGPLRRRMGDLVLLEPK